MITYLFLVLVVVLRFLNLDIRGGRLLDYGPNSRLCNFLFASGGHETFMRCLGLIFGIINF